MSSKKKLTMKANKNQNGGSIRRTKTNTPQCIYIGTSLVSLKHTDTRILIKFIIRINFNA